MLRCENLFLHLQNRIELRQKLAPWFILENFTLLPIFFILKAWLGLIRDVSAVFHSEWKFKHPHGNTFRPKRFVMWDSKNLKIFHSKRQFRPPYGNHFGQKDFKCGIYEKSFTRKDSLNLHIAIYPGQKDFKCCICRKSFTQKSHLNLHMAIHSSQKDFKCGICGKFFTQKGSWNRHMAIQSGQKDF